jgi:hypothetical protein
MNDIHGEGREMNRASGPPVVLNLALKNGFEQGTENPGTPAEPFNSSRFLKPGFQPCHHGQRGSQWTIGIESGSLRNNSDGA